MKDLQVAKTIAEAVAKLGGTTYIVGGAVRDSFISHRRCATKDYDLLVTSVPFDKLLSSIPGKVDLVGRSFGVLKTTVNDITVDVALPRTEKSIGSGHKDFNVQYDHALPVEVDLARRDFTMNALAKNVLTGELIDPFHGVSDITSKCIRTVGKAADRFNEDPLRMLRAVRFASTLEFNLSADTVIGISANSELLKNIAPERISEEMDKLLLAKSPSHVREALRTLRDTGLLETFIPEFKDSYNFDQKNPFHCYTVDEHVFNAVHHAVAINASKLTLWAILLHDIAKPATFSIDANGRGHFYGHEKVGAEMVTAILSRLKFSSENIRNISLLVREHLRPISPKPGATVSDKALRRYVACLGDLALHGLDCREADIAAHAGCTADFARSHVAPIRERIRHLESIKGFTQAKLALRGDSIARLFGVSGENIGRIKKMATNAVIDGEVANEHDAIIRWIVANEVHVQKPYR